MTTEQAQHQAELWIEILKDEREQREPQQSRR